MLDTAVRALETDQTRALEMFKSDHPAFKQGDLYVYYADSRGTILAHGLPQLIGQELATLKDKAGKEFGQQLLNEARQGLIGFATYFLPKPNGTDEIYKEDYFTKVGKLTCGARSAGYPITQAPAWLSAGAWSCSA